MHVSRTFTGVAAGLQETGSLISSGTLPLLYAGAMLVDAVAALFFGLLYDKKGVRALVWSTVLSAPFAIFVFAGHSVASLLVGIALWGVGMGAQESILKAAVSSMVPKASRATGYGVFECAFGVFWFLGSWLLGVLYDVSIPAMIAVSVAAQLAAIPLYIASSRRIKATHELHKAPQQLAAIEDDHRAADLVDDVQDLFVEPASQQGYHRGQGQEPQDGALPKPKINGRSPPWGRLARKAPSIMVPSMRAWGFIQVTTKAVVNRRQRGTFTSLPPSREALDRSSPTPIQMTMRLPRPRMTF